MEQVRFEVEPIGHIEASEQGFMIKVEEKFKAAMNGLKDFGHLVVVWWSHHCDTDEFRNNYVTEQPYKNAPKELGVFATRSPARPNPIAITTVAAIHVDEENSVIRIPYIDAENMTPVLDIKPYHPSLDRIRDIQMPEWFSHWPKWAEESAEFDWEAEFVNAQ